MQVPLAPQKARSVCGFTHVPPQFTRPDWQESWHVPALQNLAGAADGSSRRTGACAARSTVVAVGLGVDALASALGQSGTAGHGRADAGRAGLRRAAGRAGERPRARAARAAVGVVRLRVDALPAAVHGTCGAGDLARPRAADLAQSAGHSRGRPRARAARPAGCAIALRVHALAAAVHQAGLARELTGTGAANLSGAARCPGRRPGAGAARAAERAVRLRVHALATTVHEPRLAGERASPRAANLAAGAGLAAGAAVPVVGRHIGAGSATDPGGARAVRRRAGAAAPRCENEKHCGEKRLCPDHMELSRVASTHTRTGGGVANHATESFAINPCRRARPSALVSPHPIVARSRPHR